MNRTFFAFYAIVFAQPWRKTHLPSRYSMTGGQSGPGIRYKPFIARRCQRLRPPGNSLTAWEMARKSFMGVAPRMEASSRSTISSQIPSTFSMADELSESVCNRKPPMRASTE